MDDQATKQVPQAFEPEGEKSMLFQEWNLSN